MNLKSNIINNAIAGFINMFKCGSRSFIVKRLSAFLLSLIIFVSSVFCQYCTAVVSAAEVGAIVAVDLIVELAVTGGIVAGIMRGAQILQGEIESGYGFGSAGLDDYANSVNQQLIDGVNDGSISNAQAGTVNKLSGVPVEIICPVYGIYQFLCTNELCNKIRMENPQTEEGVKQIVSAYWSSVNILDQRTFEEIASDPRNWVTNLDLLDSTGSAITAKATFESFGEDISTIDPSFYQTGIAGKFNYHTSSDRSYDIKVSNVSNISNYNDFVLIRSFATINNQLNIFIRLYGHLVSDNDPTLYSYISGFSSRVDQFLNFNNLSGIKELTLSEDKSIDLGFVGNTAVSPLDLSLIISNWGDLRGIEATDAIDLVDWCLGDSRFWNTDVIDLAVDEIADFVDAQVDTGEGTGAIDVPIDFPIDIPIEGEDLAFPGTDTEEDFDDPPAYPGTDEWADVDETDWPTFDPDPEDPDPEDPDPEDPDNPSGGDPPELPQLKVPVLLTLFPFCIPFDIKRSIEWFGDAGNSSGTNNNSVSEQYNTGVYNNMSSSEAEEINGNGMEPVFAIPLNIGVSGRPVLQTTVVLDLTEYGIPVLVQYLKTVQIIAWIIVLGVATYKFIY